MPIIWKIMKVCVTGGSGFVGKNLVRHLRQNGVAARLLTRNREGKVLGAEYFVADLTDPAATLSGLFDDVDIVFHCAGEVQDLPLMRALHVAGTEKLLSQVKVHFSTSTKPLHWVQLSSVGVYGPPVGRADLVRDVNENSPVAPQGEYETTKAESDRLIMQFAQTESLFSYSIVRPSIVIGNDMTNKSVRSLVSAIRSGLFFYIGSTSTVATYIHIEDVIDAIMLCAVDARAKGQIFNLSNDCLLSDIVDAVRRHASTKSRLICVPEQPVRILSRLLGMFGKFPLTSQRIDALIRRTRYSDQKIKDMLGYTPQHPIPETIATLFNE